MARTRKHRRSKSGRKHQKRPSSGVKRLRMSRRTRRNQGRRLRGGVAKHVDNTFVNDALPYGEYRTAKGIRSGFQIRM